uniref:phospholipase A2 n=1 Tax=Dicentrarchus labrax TaxID=13489 RepID=A0A8C4EUB1_DICLA
MTHIANLIAVILTSSLLRWTPAEASLFCTWTKVLRNGQVHYFFLRGDPLQAPPSLRFYHSSWSGERAPLSCAWSEDAAVIQNYLSLCRERGHEFPKDPDENFDPESIFEADDLCVSMAYPGVDGRTGKKLARSVGGLTAAGSSTENQQGQAERSEVRAHQRVKRGFIVPGTLWCGSGNKAPSYADLGVFADTDSCCREHDQCKHTILSFQSEFGVFNSNIFTMSHCDCDNKFRNCLMESNDSIADVVGYTFFNLLKMHCFEFSHRLQCAERNWFGMCKETKMALYAEVYAPTQYESEVSMNSTSFIINTTVPTEVLESSTSQPQLFSITAAASTVPTPSASITPVSSVTTSSVSSTSEGPTGTAPESGDHEQLSCAVYKDLDACRNKILPQQRRYGLHNPEATTLYHCNCTTRQLTEVQALLLGHVSQSCFLPQDCTLPQLDQRSGADVEEQRHLQAMQLKVRRPNARRAKRKDRAVRLHKLCLRMHSKVCFYSSFHHYVTFHHTSKQL